MKESSQNTYHEHAINKLNQLETKTLFRRISIGFAINFLSSQQKLSNVRDSLCRIETLSVQSRNDEFHSLQQSIRLANTRNEAEIQSLGVFNRLVVQNVQEVVEVQTILDHEQTYFRDVVETPSILEEGTNILVELHQNNLTQIKTSRIPILRHLNIQKLKEKAWNICGVVIFFFGTMGLGAEYSVRYILPKATTMDQLKESFKNPGEITDQEILHALATNDPSVIMSFQSYCKLNPTESINMDPKTEALLNFAKWRFQISG